jgi:multicomponent Na+:H+ antiporter subunit B
MTGVLLVFSIFLLLRGHNLPGGGFGGGLVAASAVVLHALAQGFHSARQMLWIYPRVLVGIGLSIAIISGLLGVVVGQPFLTGLWGQASWPVVGKLGTPLLFDVGVYLTVLGVVCLIVFSLGEDEED